MANRTIVWSGLLGAILLVTTAVANAEMMPTSASGHVEALCHSWTESPCLLRVGGWIKSERGVPLAGKRLRFVSAGRSICSSTTDSYGRASCLGMVESGRTVAESGYRIVFDGDGPLLAESAEGRSIVRIGATQSP